MIAKVTRGQQPSGAVRYLFGLGRYNEHEDAHVVAASASLRVRRACGRPRPNWRSWRRPWTSRPCCSARRCAGGACWHLSLSTKAGTDRELSDAEWAEVAKAAMSRLGFEASGHRVACRWAAVRHGRSSAGNDHVHVVVNLVREDGEACCARPTTSVGFPASAPTWRAATGSVPSRGGPRKRPCPGSPGPRLRRHAAPDGRKPNGPSWPGWCGLRLPSPAAKPSSCGCLRDAGLAARPRYDRVGGHRVVGYAVAEEPSDGGVAVFFGGGKLARDLSLPALRERWGDGEAERQKAAAEWACAAPATCVHQAPRASRHTTYRWAEASERWGKSTLGEEHRVPAQRSQGRWREATEGLGEVVRQLGAVPAEDVTTWRAVASDAAGALAVLSGRLERVPGPLAHASGLLARSAQGPRQRPAKARYVMRGTIKSVAALMAQADLDEDTPAAWRLLLAEMLRLAQAVHDAHLARSESRAGSPPGRRGPEALDNVRARLGPLGALRAELLAVVEPARRGRRAWTGRGCQASAPTDGQRCTAARAVRPDDSRAGIAETVLRSGEVSNGRTGWTNAVRSLLAPGLVQPGKRRDVSMTLRLGATFICTTADRKSTPYPSHCSFPLWDNNYFEGNIMGHYVARAALDDKVGDGGQAVPLAALRWAPARSARRAATYAPARSSRACSSRLKCST